MSKIQNDVLGSFKPEVSEYTEKTKDCLGLTENIPLATKFEIVHAEIFVSEYEGKVTTNAILDVKMGKVENKYKTSGKTIIATLQRKNDEGVTLLDFINQGNALSCKLGKVKNSTNQFFSFILESA